MKLNLLALALAVATFAVAACNQTASQDAEPPASSTDAAAVTEQEDAGTGAQVAEASTGEKVNLVFLDLTGFDDDLSASLASQAEEVVIEFPGRTTLNDLPKRLDPWLSTVKDSGGQVSAFPVVEQGEERSRGIVGILIDVATKAHEAYEYKEKLEPAKAYDVQLDYHEDTGRVMQARFIHK
ncbi:MAG: hypothetical protein RIM72_01290 [Alphaproteobacteria bacterium]